MRERLPAGVCTSPTVWGLGLWDNVWESLSCQPDFPCVHQVSPTHHHPGGSGEQRQHAHTVLSSPPRGTVSLRYDRLTLRTSPQGIS